MICYQTKIIFGIYWVNNDLDFKINIPNQGMIQYFFLINKISDPDFVVHSVEKNVLRKMKCPRQW